MAIKNVPLILVMYFPLNKLNLKVKTGHYNASVGQLNPYKKNI